MTTTIHVYVHANLGQDDVITYSDATATAYQEWNVIKKNRFGKIQERTIGIDGRKLYNGTFRYVAVVVAIIKIRVRSEDGRM
jgi:hypothetical protein